MIGRLYKKSRRVIRAAGGLAKARLFNVNKPLVVGWSITNRCNRRCLYCALWQKKADELSTKDVLNIVDELSGMGTMMISLTGGEPLLRDDIGRIIRHIHDKGIEVKLNSNGSLVKTKIADIKNVDLLNLSLEGPESVHDAIRGAGSYREVMEAASIARENGIKTNYVMVLTNANLDSVDFVLDEAGKVRGRAHFQPATTLVLGGRSDNPLIPAVGRYRIAVQGLIEKKRRGDRRVGSSVSALRHILSWPEPRSIVCASGGITCRIEPNGDVIYCSREKEAFRAFNCKYHGFKAAFKHLKPMSCSECWCAGRLELNYSYLLDRSSLTNQIFSAVS